MQNEIWKAIPGYENLYEVSNLGRVRNSKTQKVMSLSHTSQSYLKVALYKNKTSRDGFYSICKCCRNTKAKSS